MDVLIGLLILGFILSAALFFFQFIFGIVIIIFGIVMAGVAALFDWIFNNRSR